MAQKRNNKAERELSVRDDLMSEGSRINQTIFPPMDPYVSKYHLQSLLTSRDSFGETSIRELTPKRLREFNQRRSKKYKDMFSFAKE